HRPALPPSPHIIISVLLLLIIAQTCRKDLTNGTDNSTNYKVFIQFGRERERIMTCVVYCRCLLPFWTLLSFLVLVPIIYAIVVELDALFRKNYIHEHCSQPYAFKCTLTSCTIISAVTGKHIYKKTMPMTSLNIKGCLIYI